MTKLNSTENYRHVSDTCKSASLRITINEHYHFDFFWSVSGTRQIGCKIKFNCLCCQNLSNRALNALNSASINLILDTMFLVLPNFTIYLLKISTSGFTWALHWDWVLDRVLHLVNYTIAAAVYSVLLTVPDLNDVTLRLCRVPCHRQPVTIDYRVTWH